MEEKKKAGKLEKVVKFYQSIPDDVKKSVFDKIEYINREQRRAVSKIKSVNDKIRYLFLNMSTRKMLSDAAYSVAIQHLDLSLKTATYEKIVDSITDDNKFYYTMFFFRWCYEENEDGIHNDDNYFDVFVDSELFNKIISGESLCDTHYEPKENNELHSLSGSSETANIAGAENDIENSESDVKIINNEVSKMKLVGRIERRNTFYNFFPQYEFVNGELKEIDDAVERYPEMGAINLSYAYSGKSEQFLSELSTDSQYDEVVNNVYVLEVDKCDLEENANDTYRVKVDLEKLIHNGQTLENVIKRADLVGIYKIVTSDVSINSQNDLLSNELVFLKEENINEGEEVILHYNGKYYGPFKANCREKDGKFYIKPLKDNKKYLVKMYDRVRNLQFEKKPHSWRYMSPPYAYIIYTPVSVDVIRDDILLERVKDDISLELAVSDTDVFIERCSNSPFFSDIPLSIREKRIERLREIVHDTESYKEAKREIFDELLKEYKNQSFEDFEEIIKGSKQYKELQSSLTEERSKNEDKDKTIQALQDENDDLRTKIDESSNSAGITEEEVSKYEEQIAQLHKDKDELQKQVDANKKIDDLKNEITKLEGQREYANEQAIKAEQRRNTAAKEVSDAINKGINEATAAFDPYISSEMLKAAAKWSSDAEADDYAKRSDGLNDIEPSGLVGDELINHVVNYVQSRREYERNDIINIYISIAQNFLTIFSGEPGTGKTSICNIISETLGLNSLGDNINRFVSVSVERGWSSKRDLIGYFNPLTRKYDKSNGKIYDALRILDNERDTSKYPFLIMLDEANLSPIEYYWADFMRLTDRTSMNDAYINIGIEREIFIPETLRFLATINTDQTTEALSPRLIDRACIIKLPNVKPKLSISSSGSKPGLVSWANFYDAFSKGSELTAATQKTLKDIYDLFNRYGMSVSPRIQIGIERYVKTAQTIMVDETNVLKREKAIDYAIIQKLLPKINGYYTNYERFFELLKQLCLGNNLLMTRTAIEKMELAQERNMGYCQYLI